jgi:putative SOS response-associated peptidase YedK
MCGRYQLVHPSLMAQRFGVEQQALDVFALAPNVNVSPTQRVPAVLAYHTLEVLRWGIIQPWAKDMHSAAINARAESIAEKATFRRAFRGQRCLIPASGFYEWQTTAHLRTKTPFLFTVKDADLFAFAGLYEVWRDPASGHELRTCAIITTTPNALVVSVHDRMPVILLPEDEAEWLDLDEHDVGRLGALLRPYPAEAMVATLANRADLRG